MSFKYFLDISPEEEVIHISLLTKFRKQRLQDVDLLSLLINKTAQICLEKGLIKSKLIIVDSTHSLSRSKPKHIIELLQKHTKDLVKSLHNFSPEYTDIDLNEKPKIELDEMLIFCKEITRKVELDEAVNTISAITEKLNLLKELSEDIAEDLLISKDTDVRIGYKSKDNSFFGYKTHLAMTEERIITAAVVTSGEKSDGKELPKLLKISQENGVEFEAIIGDAAYSSKENIALSNAQNIEVVAKLNPIITQGA